jgi:hypothetical protein
MPNLNAPASKRYNGWYRDQVNGVLEWYHNGTKIGQASGATVTMSGASAATALTASTGDITATAGHVVATAGDLKVTAGNVRLGVISAFATTEPTSAVVMKAGTAPSGAITTSGGIFTDGTTVKKIIAAGTVSDVQT